jgi:hypothetical protein
MSNDTDIVQNEEKKFRHGIVRNNSRKLGYCHLLLDTVPDSKK